MGYQAVIKDSDVIEGLSIRFLKIFKLLDAVNEYRSTGNRSTIIKIYIASCIVLSIPSVIFQIQSTFTIEFDLRKATFISIHIFPAISLCYRIIVLWFRMDSLCRLYDLMRNDFFNIPERLRADARMVYKETNNKSNMFYTVLFMWNAGLLIWFVAYPSVSVDYIQQRRVGSMPEVTTGKMKIVGSWYPFQVDEYPYYEIVMAYEAVHLAFGITITTFCFNMFFQILMCLYAQFVLLSFLLSRLKVDVTDSGIRSSGKSGPSKSILKINRELNEILMDHQKLLSYAEEAKSLYNPMVTISIGIGILILITGASQLLLGKKSDPSLLFHLFQIFCFQFIEMALFCYGSSLLENASKDIHFAIYCSDWYKADVKFRKAAQMAMLRAKKGVNLTAVFMYPLNLQTLGSICQFTYSSAALMTGMVD